MAAIAAEMAATTSAGMPFSTLAGAALARALAKEFAVLGVRINLVSPGPTATPLWDGLGLPESELEQLADSLGQRLLPGHFVEAAAVARVIAFQLSAGARGVYGQDWVVDNGYSLT